MEPRSKSKLDVPSGCDTEEFTRFKELAKQLVSVPKKDIQEREKKAAKSAPKKERS
jgi:hypothetical protein